MKSQFLRLLEKVAGNHNISEQFYNINPLADILLLPLECWKHLGTSPQVKVFNFQDLTHKTDFFTFCGSKVFHLLRNTAYYQLNIFPDPIHVADFDIYDPVKIFNFQKYLAQNKYIYM